MSHVFFSVVMYVYESWTIKKAECQRTGSLEKTLVLGKTEGRRRRGWQEDEMVACHHRVNGHEFEQVLGIGDGQGSLACCSPCGRKELDTTEWLTWEGGKPHKIISTTRWLETKMSSVMWRMNKVWWKKMTVLTD